jgi:hypothetical protein
MKKNIYKIIILIIIILLAIFFFNLKKGVDDSNIKLNILIDKSNGFELNE